jgi:epoxyqueuosine reductase
VDLIPLLELSSAGYRKLVRKSALRRAHRATLARNAAVALGNSGDARAIAPLCRALERHASALVRGHAAWALGRLADIPSATAHAALTRASREDPDEWVREEARLALGWTGAA